MIVWSFGRWAAGSEAASVMRAEGGGETGLLDSLSDGTKQLYFTETLVTHHEEEEEEEKAIEKWKIDDDDDEKEEQEFSIKIEHIRKMKSERKKERKAGKR